MITSFQIDCHFGFYFGDRLRWSRRRSHPSSSMWHEHFNGEPGVLDDLLSKLNAADGIGFLLVTPKGFPTSQVSSSGNTRIDSSVLGISSST